MLAAGLAIRVVFVLTTSRAGDLDAMRIVGEMLTDRLLDAYVPELWPYPPGYFPVLAGAAWAAGDTGNALVELVRVPLVLADLLLAWMVFRMLERAGRAREALAAAALVALGPAFILVSSYHGQLDTIAMLPAAYAMVMWQRRRPGSLRAALAVGLLIGCGAAVKTVPILLLIALLPTARSVREWLVAAMAAGAVPLLLLVPYLVHDLDHVRVVMDYRGVPGQGGLSLLVQPQLADAWNLGSNVQTNAANRLLSDHGWVLVVGALLLTAVRLRRMRLDPLTASVVVCLTLYVFGGNFFVQYGVWVLPFLLLAGRLRAAAAVQLVLLVPMAIAYTRPHDQQWISTAYTVAILLGLAAAAWWYVQLMRGEGASGQVRADGGGRPVAGAAVP